MNKFIQTDKAPNAIGPYSQAVIVGDFLYISGQLPINSSINEFTGKDITTQTKQCLLNIKTICEAAKVTLNHIVKVNIFLQDLTHFKDMNAVYE